MVVSIIGLVGWDLVANFNSIVGDTVSEITGNVFKTTPILAVVLGVVVGHLASYFVGLDSILKFISDRPIIAVLYGIAGGFFFWNLGR